LTIKLVSAGKIPSLFSLALLAKFYFAAKTIGLWYWYKTPILKQPSTLLGSLAQALQLTQLKTSYNSL
jgi:hypothetical protein